MKYCIQTIDLIWQKQNIPLPLIKYLSFMKYKLFVVFLFQKDGILLHKTTLTSASKSYLNKSHSK